MAIDKRINYNVQGNVKNYLGKQKIVKAPLHWQSSPKHPTTELAYITKKEKDLIIKKDLHKSLKGGVNRGPSGIISLNGWGDAPSGGQGPAGSSGGGYGETGKSYGDQETISVVPGGGTVTTSPKDTFEQSWSGQPGFLGFGGGYRNLKTPGVTPEYGGAYKSKFGLGALGRGLLSFVGGIPGKIASGIMTAKNWAKNRGTGALQGFKEFSEHDNFMNYWNRNKAQAIQPIEEIGQDIDTGYSRTHLQSLANDMNTQPINTDYNLPTEATDYLSSRGINFNQGGRVGYERGRVVNPGGYNGVIDRNIANLRFALENSDLTDEERAQVEADLQMSIEAKGGWEDQLLSGDPVSKADGGLASLV